MSEPSSLVSGESLRLVAEIREEMPAVTNTVYLNTGTCGPLPRRTVAAMEIAQQEELLHGRIAPNHYPHLFEAIQGVKAIAAEILHCESSELALSRHTTDGMNLALAGYPWKPGDEILLSNLEHPSGLLPTFLARRRFGVGVRVADIALGEGETSAIVEGILLSRARAGKEKIFIFQKFTILHQRGEKEGGTRRSESMLRCNQPSRLPIATK